MKTKKHTLSLTNYTLVNEAIQLKINFNTEIYIQDDVKLRLVKNITSKEGIKERINRSIQAEGAFSKIKEGLSYNRFHHKGKANIISEINLISIA